MVAAGCSLSDVDTSGRTRCLDTTGGDLTSAIDKKPLMSRTLDIETSIVSNDLF